MKPGERYPEPPTAVIIEELRVLRDGISAWAQEQARLRVIGAAGSHAEALDLVRELRPRLVLVEPLVCHRDPREFIAALCEQAEVVVVYTAACDERLVRMFESSGAAAVIDKGSDPAELTNEVWRLLERP